MRELPPEKWPNAALLAMKSLYDRGDFDKRRWKKLSDVLVMWAAAIRIGEQVAEFLRDDPPAKSDKPTARETFTEDEYAAWKARIRSDDH